MRDARWPAEDPRLWPRASRGGRRSPRAFVTQPGMLIGTPAYMAPEQLNGGPVDARADVFAFGAVLYEYICGVHPFAAATPLATVARVLESDARPLGDLCPHVPGRGRRVHRAVPAQGAADRFRYGRGDRRRARARRRVGRVARRQRPGGASISSSSSACTSAPRRSAGRSRNGSRRRRRCRCSSRSASARRSAACCAGHLVFTERMNRAHLGERAPARAAERWSSSTC